MSQPTQTAHPLFYTKLEALIADRHGKLGLMQENSYAFAKDAVSVPVSAVEVPIAHAYPIVFANVAPWMPLAVTGLRQGENLFVEKDGSWQPGIYIPAYVRRYPFILARTQEPGQFALCIDTASPRFVTTGGQPLFDGADATELTRSALQFCGAYEQELEATRKLMEIIHATNILVPNQAKVNLPSGSSLSLTDFLAVDEAKFAALPDAVFLQLRAANALPLIYGHLASRATWSELLRRLA